MKYRAAPMDSAARRGLETIIASLAAPETAEDDGWTVVFDGLTARALDQRLAAAGILDTVETDPVIG
ncbi:MAG TPA: hypothetical protein VK558_08010 [Patescibacteria group bacterium]|nr:hypothetical protein [Patescibacteria group bacterium]